MRLLDAIADPFWGDTVPCAGKWALFDSIRPDDHRDAAAICAMCPAIAACRELLRDAQTKAVTSGGNTYGPRGTWAGHLIGETDAEVKRRRNAYAREHGTDRGYGQHRYLGEQACDDCKRAHRAQWHLRKVAS